MPPVCVCVDAAEDGLRCEIRVLEGVVCDAWGEAGCVDGLGWVFRSLVDGGLPVLARVVEALLESVDVWWEMRRGLVLGLGSGCCGL